MFIYIYFLLAVLCLTNLIKVIYQISAVIMADPDDLKGEVVTLIWRICSLGAKVTAWVFAILLL